MKNLKLVDKVKCDLDKIENVRGVFVDPNSVEHNLIVRTETDVFIYDCENDSVREIVSNPAKIIDWEYLALNNEICIAREDGEVLVANLGNDSVESVTFCEGGLEKMSWSPDQEVVAFVTAAKSVVIMNCGYDPISESSLEDEAFGDQEFITVGWGKKDTQFHGSEGKAAAKKKSSFVPVEDVSILDQTVSITWRGDGEYFAVSFVANYGRAFKVFNKEGCLQFTSEKLNNLGEAIAWRPSGNWIAVPHRFPNKYTIGLFEKNGLRHREIVLPFQQDLEPVVNLSWSNDSDVLAVETDNDGKSNIYLYTIGNYHWYLKQCLNFNEKVNMMYWDTGFHETKSLHVVLVSGIYVKYRWTWDVCTTSGNTMSNLCITSVVDGKQLLLTDFRNSVIPPPMFKCVLESDESINFTGFINDPQNPQKLFIVTSKGTLRTYSVETQQNNLRSGERMIGVNLMKEYSYTDEASLKLPLNYSHWIWINEDQFIFCDVNTKESTIILYNLKENTKQSRKVNGQIVATNSVTKDTFSIHLVSGEILTIKIKENQLSEPDLLILLPEYCEHVQPFMINNQIKCVSLKDNQNLYLNDTKLATGATSFFNGEHYFAFTQLTSMKFIRLDKFPDSTVVSERRIERGAKLVAIIPKESTTVLQMPRGNLEAIQPRVLSLQIVVELLDASEYEKTMLLLRKQRINLNIIFDHNPKKLMSEIEIFLAQISKPHWLNLFLTELENEDYTQTKYASNYELGKVEYPENFTIENKVKYVCQHFCAMMKSKNDDKFIQPIITAHVKLGELENALSIVWDLREEELKDPNTRTDPSSSKALDALKFLLYMANVNELYDVALGMYNFPLVLFVASKSQKDPKEYIPFLKEFNALEENYKRFKIDDYLKRFEKAFQHISNCGKDRFDECLAYVEKHSLYSVALQRFENDNEEFYKSIALSFADHLRTAGKLSNASFMYERGGDLKQAIVSAKHVLDVDRCLMIAREAGYNELEIKDVALSLVPGLLANDRYQEAFSLMKNFGDDFQDALNVLMEGRHYLNAIFEAKDITLIEKLVKPHLESYSIILRSTIDADKEKFLSHKNRLQIVRIEKAKKALDDDYVDEGDLISEATSVTSKYTGTSRSSGKTFRSSKNRRKHERKLLNLKEGGKFEDIALIDALFKLTQHIFSQQQQIHNICKALIEVRLDGEARLVQASFRDLLKTVLNRLDEIWIPEMMNTTQTMMGPNIDYAQVQNDQHYAMIPPQQRFKPQLNIIDWEHAILK